MSEMRFTFTEDDLVAAQRAWWTGIARWQTFVKGVLALWVAYVLVFFVIEQLDGSSLSVGEAVVFLPISVAVIAVCFVIGYAVAPYRARKAYREHKALHGDHTVSWNDEAIEIASTRGTSDLPWSIFHGWLDGPETLLLYQSNQLFNPLPKRALPPGAADDIIDRLVSAGVPERPRFGFLRARAPKAK